MDENIHNIAIEGVFDDCQDIVKALSNDLEFKRKYKIGTVNSINWARLAGPGGLLLQRVISRATRLERPAGQLHGAQRQFRQHLRRATWRRMMGPAHPPAGGGHERETTCSTSSSAPAHRMRGQRRHARNLQPRRWTSARASNFERFVFDLLGHDGAACKALLHTRSSSTAVLVCRPMPAPGRTQAMGSCRHQLARRPPGHHPRNVRQTARLIDTTRPTA